MTRSKLHYFRIANLAILLIMIIGSIASVFIPTPVYAATAWYDSSYQYRKAITITGSQAGAQTNYQIQLIVNYLASADSVDFTREPAAATNTADAGTGATTLVDAALLGTTNDYYVGAYLYNVTRTLGAYITSYDAAAKTITNGSIAGQVATDTYYIVAKIPFTSVDSKSQTDFDDLRFTASDGITLLDAWLETYVASSAATVWVEVGSIPQTTTTTIYMYYGNASVASNWSAANTFIAYDDFERGVDGDTIGGNWTEAIPHVHISTDYAYGGTRCAKWIGHGVTYANANIPVTASNNIAVRFRYWKEETAGALFNHGSGARVANSSMEADETYQYYNGGAWAASGTCSKNAWALTEQNDFNWSVNTYDYWNAEIQQANNITNYAGAAYPNVWNIGSNFLGVGVDYYIDNFMVRRYVTPEPLITAYATMETVPTPLVLESAKVFSSYATTGDWLIALLYTNIYEPYYRQASDVTQYFYIQLLNGTTVVASTVCPDWGFRLGCIYLAPSGVAPLTWGSAYKVRIYGNFTPNPYIEYTLTAADWTGSDMTFLDRYVLSKITLIETYYGQTYTTYIAGRGRVLNESGGVLAVLGIPALSTIRPNIFSIVNITPPYEGDKTAIAKQADFIWQTKVGASLTTLLTNIGNLISVDGKMIGMMFAFAVWVIAAAVLYPPGHTISALALNSPLIIAAVYMGFLDLAIMGVMLAVIILLFVWQFYLKGA